MASTEELEERVQVLEARLEGLEREHRQLVSNTRMAGAALLTAGEALR